MITIFWNLNILERFFVSCKISQNRYTAVVSVTNDIRFAGIVLQASDFWNATLSSTDNRRYSVSLSIKCRLCNSVPCVPTRLNCRAQSLRRRAMCSIGFATSSRRVPTDLIEKLKTEHVESSWIVSAGVYSRIKYSTCSVVNYLTKSVVSCEFNTHRQRRRNSTRQLSIGVLMYWA